MLRFCVTGVLAASITFSGACAADGGWPDWDHYSERFVQDDGRVIDLTFDQKSTSEGQSYGMFFALVANDRARFDRIYHWANDNLAEHKLGERLPAWLWGQRNGDDWGVKDDNAAADGDLWMAYDLLEAGRLWKAPQYEAVGRKLLAKVKEKEVVDAGKAGTLLLPGPVGFDLGGGRYRIDPSYLPQFQLRYFAVVDPKGPWQAILDSYRKLQPQLFSKGVAPDTAIVTRDGEVLPDTERKPSGSYDAIRVYLWTGMTPGAADEARALRHYAELTKERGAPPEKVDPTRGKPMEGDFSPTGFSGAMLPFLSTLGDGATLKAQQQRLLAEALKQKLHDGSAYYDQSLILFGKGWLDGQYRFDADGKLQPRWH